MIYSCLSDIGNVRKNNEDYCKGEIIYLNNDTIGIFALADGMGGHNKGELASELAVTNIIKLVKENLIDGDNIKIDYIDDIIKKSYFEVNNIIYNKAKEFLELQGMGTTLVLAVVYNDEVCIANVGDSRAYIFRGNTLSQITMDHSVVEELMRAEIITEEEAKNHPRRHQITRAMGTDPLVIVDIFKEKLNRKDKVLLCSDGLTGFVDVIDILRMLKKDRSTNILAHDLVNFANNSKGKDNVSVIVIENN
ncbi:MAG: Stp1/IreP family PP2C-type Ser/Thr phosphatase [Peptostreptococcaceae bacterium]